MHLAGIGRGFHGGMGVNCGKVYHQSRSAVILSELLLYSLTSFNSVAWRVRSRSSRNQTATIAPTPCGCRAWRAEQGSGQKGRCARACCLTYSESACSHSGRSFYEKSGNVDDFDGVGIAEPA